MNKKEAIQAMLDGKKVRRSIWSDKKSYYCLSEDGIYQDQGRKWVDMNYYDTDCWEIYTEPPKPKFKVGEWVIITALNRYGRIKQVFELDCGVITYQVNEVSIGNFGVFETGLQAVAD